MSAHSFSSNGGTIKVLFLSSIFLVTSCRKPEPPVPPDVVKGIEVVGENHLLTGGIRASALLESVLNRIVDERVPELDRFISRIRSLIGLGIKSDTDRETVLVGSLDLDLKTDSPAFYPLLSGVVVTPLSLEAIRDGLSEWPDVELTDSSGGSVFFRLYADEMDAFLGISEHAIVGTTADRSSVEDMLRTSEQIDTQDGTPSPELSSLMRSAAVNDFWVVVDPLQDLLSAVSRSASAPGSEGFARPLIRAADAVSIGLRIVPDGLTVYVYVRPNAQVRAGDLEDLLKGAIATAGLPEETPDAIRSILDTSDTDVNKGLVRLRLRLSNEEIIALMKLRDRREFEQTNPGSG
jgi:hypothetical protein